VVTSSPCGDPLGEAPLAEAFHRLYIGEAAARPRKEDTKKLVELGGLLALLASSVPARKRELVGVDAAAGKAYVGLLAAELIFAARGQSGAVRIIERDEDRVALCRDAMARTRAPGFAFEAVAADVRDLAAWPNEPDFVVALHACGPASDAVLDAAVAVGAKRLFLVPCCTSKAVPFAPFAEGLAERLGIPSQAEVRRPFLQAMVDAERTLRLESLGYETMVVPFVPKAVTPFNLLWKSVRVREPGRMRAAEEKLRRLRGA